MRTVLRNLRNTLKIPARGTARKIPQNPRSSPPAKMANITHSGWSPTRSPVTLGTKTVESNHCMKPTSTRAQSPVIGELRNATTRMGMLPITGPKYGMNSLARLSHPTLPRTLV